MVGERLQIARNRRNARLRGIRAIDPYPKRSDQIIPITIVGTRYWIGICDERQKRSRWQAHHWPWKRWGHSCMTSAIAKRQHVTGAHHDVVRNSPTHHRLVVVVG